VLGGVISPAQPVMSEEDTDGHTATGVTVDVSRKPTRKSLLRPA